MNQPRAQDPPRGGAPVGMLNELPPVELAAILYLRLWFSGQQTQIRQEFINTLGLKGGKSAILHFERLMENVARHARRPMMRHGTTCQCFGGDECAFAQFVAAAANGDEHDAMTFALHLFDGVRARCVLGTAAMCGLAFASIARDCSPGMTPTHPPLHRHH